jgi:hypothetical protein
VYCAHFLTCELTVTSDELVVVNEYVCMFVCMSDLQPVLCLHFNCLFTLFSLCQLEDTECLEQFCIWSVTALLHFLDEGTINELVLLCALCFYTLLLIR